MNFRIQLLKTNLLFAIIVFFLNSYLLMSCKKLIEIDPPISSITTSQTFADDNNATSAIIALYSTLIFPAPNSSDLYFGNGGLTVYCGLSADEIRPRFPTVTQNQQFLTNNVQPTLGVLSTNIWKQAYSSVYNSNACIEGLTASTTVTEGLKKQLIGEAKFIRAFIYFYLINLFGDVPLVTTTAWSSINTIPRTPAAEVYTQIIEDLKDAENKLENDFLISSNERIRVNKWGAKALLSRVYLYNRNWADAEAESSLIIANPAFNLNTDVNSVFLKNSNETIWQLQANNTIRPYTLVEASQLMPANSSLVPFYYSSTELLNSFEPGDSRRINWINSSLNNGVTYNYPFKYKYYGNGQPNSSPSEYYVVLRLAEQYLIRAEARANGAGPGLSGAIADVSKIRTRAGLPIFNGINDKDSVLQAIYHERQVELFAEWGHRWFDLIRTKRADFVLGLVKGSNWQTTDQLYPIPYSELILNPKLTQNPGY